MMNNCPFKKNFTLMKKLSSVTHIEKGCKTYCHFFVIVLELQKLHYWVEKCSMDCTHNVPSTPKREQLLGCSVSRLLSSTGCGLLRNDRNIRDRNGLLRHRQKFLSSGWNMHWAFYRKKVMLAGKACWVLDGIGCCKAVTGMDLCWVFPTTGCRMGNVRHSLLLSVYWCRLLPSGTTIRNGLLPKCELK